MAADAEQPLWVFRITSGLTARLAPISLVLFAGSIALYVLLARQSLATATFSVPVLIFIVPAVLVVHEALHGLGFIVFGGRPKFGAGVKGVMPYFFATNPGRRFTWGPTLVIGVLPLVVIDVVALALAGSSTFAVPAMLAFALNTSGAVADLWIIAVILQTPRTALFEDTDEPAMIAWPGPGTQVPARPPRGLDPQGYESVVTWSTVGLCLFLLMFLAMSVIEFALARAAADGRLAVGNVELASGTVTNGRFSGHYNLVPTTALAAVFAIVLTWAARLLAHRRRGSNARRSPEDDV
jgi:hypothetical protein